MLQYNCTINGNIQNWIVTEFQQNSKTIQVFSTGATSPSSDPDYTVTFTGYTMNPPQLSSSLSLVATIQSDKSIICENHIDSMNKQCAVQIIGKHNRMWTNQFYNYSLPYRSSGRCYQCNYSSNCSGECYCHMVPS